MQLKKQQILDHNEKLLSKHQSKLHYAKAEIESVDEIIKKLIDFQIAIPSWALGTGGTRFGRFAGVGEPRFLEEKMEDVGLIHALNTSSGSISLHIPWDSPEDYNAIKNLASHFGLKFDAVNSNTFQDQPNQTFSYKYGSLQNENLNIRKQAIQHNIEVIQHGINLGSKSITIWLSDGSCFPGQLNFRRAYQNTLESLQEIYSNLPSDWTLLLEYKSFEPNFYSMTVGDWGMSYSFVQKLGDRAKTLVDLGHHLPNTNIEQIVATLLMEGKLGGFHFNDSKYGDDDLTAGSMKPYQLFLIFNELVEGLDSKNMNHASDMGWMIDANHIIKDPLEDLLQSVEAIMIAYAQALSVNQMALTEAQLNNDVTRAQELLQAAFRTDVRALVAEARLRSGGALNPLQLYRDLEVRKILISERGSNTVATGL
jgi:L-rhamnose isomerase/sugar isomerase